MRKLIAFFVVAAVAVTANQAFAQCATCAGSAPTFSQPVNYGAPQVFSAPVQSYAAPVQSYAAPVQSYAAPVDYGTSEPMQYGTPVEYGTSAPMQYGTPVAGSACGGCCGGCGSVGGTVVNGGVVSGGVVSGELSPYSTQGLPAGAVVVSDVVSGEGSTEGSTEGTVEGTVESTSVMGASDAVEPPTPEEDSAVDKLPAEGSATKADGT